MTGSPAIDLIVAMVLFYFGLSLACSAVNDVISYQLGWRANNLTATVRSVLQNARVAGGRQLVDVVLNHPLAQTLQRQNLVTEASGGTVRRGFGWLAQAATNPLRRLVFKTPMSATATPGEVPAPNTHLAPEGLTGDRFTDILQAALRPEGWVGPVDANAWGRWLAALPDDTAKAFKEVVQALLAAAGGDTDKFRASLAGWFDTAAAQGDVWYRQRMRYTSVLVGAAMCFGLNIDSLEVADRLYRDAQWRGVVVAQDQPLPAGAGAPVVPRDPASAVPRDPASAVPLDLKFGWGTDPFSREGWEEMWKHVQVKWARNNMMGLFVTALAISIGAPFWHRLAVGVQSFAARAKPAVPPADAT